MTREELIAYDRWLTENKWGSSEIITPEQAADLYLAKHPLPPAEGAVQLNKQIKQLKEFHTAFNLPQRQVPTIMPSPEFFLRHKILMEEVEELREAYNEGDIVEVADAITDCLYVLFGAALQFGIADKLEACFDEVHRSNMNKLGNDGKPIMREDGKVMKGENFKRPDLKRVLNEPVAAQQQPTAEGAEEFLLAQRNGNDDPITVAISKEGWIYKMVVKAMQEFATLHAQRIADKMVDAKTSRNGC